MIHLKNPGTIYDNMKYCSKMLVHVKFCFKMLLCYQICYKTCNMFCKQIIA